MIKFEILNTVLRKFLTSPRQPKYLQKPEYAHLKEKNKEIYISSAFYKHHWIWDKFKAFFNLMIQGKDYCVVANDYHLAIHEGLLMEERVQDEMAEADWDAVSWSMEMDSLFYGENASAFFKTATFEACRTLTKPMIPPTTVEFLEAKEAKRKKKNPFMVEKQPGEIRVLSGDIAMMAGKDNDNTIFTLIRAIPKDGQFIKYVSYIESMNGQHQTIQAIRMKQLFYDFDCDYLVLDTLGVGCSIYDESTKVLYDSERDVEYPAWTCMNDEKMEARSYVNNGIPLIYSIKVSGANARQLNHDIAMYVKSCIDGKSIKFLVNETEGKDFMCEKHDLLMQDSFETARLIAPYVQTTRLLYEMVNLEADYSGGFTKLTEPSRGRKDRYSSLAYGLYFIKTLEINLQKYEEDTDLFSAMCEYMM